MNSKKITFEGNGILSLYGSLISSSSNKKIKESTLGKLLVKKYLNRLGDIDNFYIKLLKGTLTKFEPNSLDTIILMILMGVYYGFNSEKYKNIRDNIYKGTEFDYRWIEIFFENLKPTNRIFHNPEKSGNAFFKEDVDPNCYKIKEEGRIALVSDWAIGTKSALYTLKCIAAFNPDYFIHLGDVYYSGTVSEYTKNLLDPISTYLPSFTRSFIIPGNHDYYSGVQGVNHCLKKINQNASFFSLYSSKLQIEGFDTGFNDSNYFNELLPLRGDIHSTYLVKEEEEWHKNRYNEAKKKNRKVIILSHHQIISNIRALGKYENKTSPLNHRLFFQAKDILHRTSFWFFGHDHMFNAFEKYVYNDIPIYRARLIGNGACQSRFGSLDKNETTNIAKFGVDKNIVPYPVSKKVIPGNFNGLLNNTFVVIDYTPTSINVTYYEIGMSSFSKFLEPKILFTEEVHF